MQCAGILLTGGASRRMGRDKASLRPEGPGSPSLAVRTARAMEVLGGPVVEVGPAHTDLPNVTEAQPGSGPLAALAAGWTALTSDGWTAPAVVVATDIPRLTAGLLSWLAGCPGSASVIPVLAGRPQLLCARYGPSDLHRAVELVATGERAVTALLTTSDALLVEEAEWAGPAGDPWAVRDADTPHELDELTAGPGALRR